MNTFIDALEKQFNYKFTENGAVAMKSTGSKVYDMFALGGAYRSRSEEDCILLFKNAFEEDATLALKCLFYLRDCRGGQGERRFFRVCYKWLTENYKEVAIRNLNQVPAFGRWDDLLYLIGTPVENEVAKLIANQLKLDMADAIDEKGISLLGKWLPSENAHSELTKKRAAWVRKKLDMYPREYRLMLSKLRKHINVLERLMSTNQWDKIEFDKIPSKAGLIYRNAFARKDLIAKKYEDFIKDKSKKVNAGTLYPYEIVEKAMSDCRYSSFGSVERESVNKYWENLPDYLHGASPSMLCVIDTSGSMWGRPIDMAISLGLYAAERMTGPFANKYISFSSHPQLIETEGVDFVDKVKRIYSTNLCENTNIKAVFDLILRTKIKNQVRDEDMPKTIVIISDMEVDFGTELWRKGGNIETLMDSIRKEWEVYGVEMPKLIYWNVDARHDTILDKGPNVSLVSGASPVIFEQVLTGKTGVELMLEVLLSDRYAAVA